MPKRYATQNGSVIRVDGKNLQVVVLPAVLAVNDAVCPECYAGKFKLICDFVQIGFDTDMYDEVCECRECHCWFVLEQELSQ